MKPAEQRLSEARRHHTEAIITQQVHQLFQRLPMLSGFWLRPDLKVTELSVFTRPGYTAGQDLYGGSDAGRSSARRGASRGGTAHARAHLCTRGALMRPKKASLLSRIVSCALPVRSRAFSPSRSAALRRPATCSRCRNCCTAGDVLLTGGHTRAAALVRCVTRSPWAHVSIYVGPLKRGRRSPLHRRSGDRRRRSRGAAVGIPGGARSRIVRPLGLNETDRQRLADWLVGHIGDPYDLPLACALCLCCLKLPAPRTMVTTRSASSALSLLVQAFLVVGHPIATSQAGSVVPRDFESAAGFEVLM